MLPAVRTNEEWEAVVWSESLIRPAAEDLAARLGLPAAELRRYPAPGLTATMPHRGGYNRNGVTSLRLHRTASGDW
jgi:hypothetical protein